MPKDLFVPSLNTRDLFQAALEFEHRWQAEGGQRIPTAWGTIYRNDRYPLLHTSNLAWVASAARAGIDEILADMDEAFRGTKVGHRSLVFEDALRAYEMQANFQERGFQATADLAMARLGLPSCIVNPEVDVRSVEKDAPKDHFETIMQVSEGEFGNSPEVVQQLCDLWRERSAGVGQKAYIAYLRGEPAGIFTVWARSGFAWIDDVTTHPSFRMQGVGRTMIFRACNLALESGCEWTLLTTNLFEPPQAMYKTLGFEPVGEIRWFYREGRPIPS